MKKDETTFRAELLKYKKQEIIDAVWDVFHYESDVWRIVHALHSMQRTKLYEDYDKKLTASVDAMTEYTRFWQSLSEKYTVDGKFDIRKCSKEDYVHLATLVNKREKADREYQLAQKAMDKFVEDLNTDD